MNILAGYAIIAGCFAYLTMHQLSIVRLISTKSDLKLRKQVIDRQHQLELNLKLTPFWPILLLKEVYDEIQQRR